MRDEEEEATMSFLKQCLGCVIIDVYHSGLCSFFYFILFILFIWID